MKNNQKADEMLKFIKKYMIEKGFEPSISEIGEAFGFRSKSSTHHYFSILETRGDIIIDAKNGKRYAVKGMQYVDMNDIKERSHAEDV